MKSRLEALTGVRFIVAFGVLLHHFGTTLVESEHWKTFLDSLSSCVSFFFVLSGFILVHAYDATSRRLGWKAFMIARLARVYPLYLVGVGLLLFPMVKYGAAIPGWRSEELVPLVVAVVFAAQAWIPRYANVLNPPGWSLSAEIFFYAIFPSLAARFRTTVFLRPGRFLLGFWIAGTVVGLLLEAYVAGDRGPSDMGTQFASFNPLVRLPEFLMGMCLAAIHAKWRPSSRLEATGLWVGGTAVLLTALVLGPTDPMRTAFHNSLLSPMYCAVILGLARSQDRATRLLSSRPMALLGEASYGLYILHVPCMYVFSLVARRADLPHEGNGFVIAYMTATIGVSIAAHLVFERPARDTIKSIFAR